MPVDKVSVEPLVTQLLAAMGEDPARDGLRRTPHRVAKMYAELLAGYDADANTILNDAIFRIAYDEMVIVKDIPFYSMCEHHMLPFFGMAYVAYVPNGKVVGLSKIPRLVDMYARRLQVQERMTQQIADVLEQVLHPGGVGVVLRAQHLCMAMRGVEKEPASMVTSAMRGAFREDLRTRSEFLNLIQSAPGFSGC